MNDNKQLKVLCDVCGFVVLKDGHELRCALPRVGTSSWSDERYAAWLGDTVQRMDVQLALRFRGVDPTVLEPTAQVYTSNSSMAAYMRSRGLAPEGRSDHSVATLFEASYAGTFRVEYLLQVFPGEAQRVLDAWVPPSIAREP